MASVNFRVGEGFSSYLELQSKIEQYQSANCVQFYKRSSRSLAAGLKRCPNIKDANEQIKYWELTFSCIHGGKEFKKRGDGSRNSSTFRMGCTGEIKFHASSDGRLLVCKSINESHNHDTNKVMFRNLFQQRRLDQNDKEHIQTLLNVKANRKMIQQKIMEQTGKVVMLKDIHNIGTSAKLSQSDLTLLQKGVDKNFNQSPLPSKIKKRGRPKGSETTVIGLPKKKFKCVRPFDLQPTEEQHKIMLKWFVSGETCSDCIDMSYIISVSDIVCTSENVHLAATERNLNEIKHYFRPDAWIKIHKIIYEAKNREWLCKKCNKNLAPVAVGCDKCLHWYHYSCDGLPCAPKAKYWLCSECLGN